MPSDDEQQPEVKDDQRESGVKRHNLTETEKRKRQLDKLFKNVDVPVKIPEPRSKTFTPKAPKEYNRNVPGSAAGAGSGEFHVYRGQKRREMERIKGMEAEARRERETLEFEEKTQRKRKEDELRTAKNRAKRQNRKKAKTTSSTKAGNDPSTTENNAKAHTATTNHDSQAVPAVENSAEEPATTNRDSPP